MHEIGRAGGGGRGDAGSARPARSLRARALRPVACGNGDADQRLRELDVPRRRPREAGAGPRSACTAPATTTLPRSSPSWTWLEALRGDDVIETPPVVRTREGARVLQVALDELDQPRNVVLFDWVEGAAPTAEDVPSFQAPRRRLGAHARPLARVDPTAIVHALRLGLLDDARRRRPLGPLAGRARHGAGRARDPDAARRDDRARLARYGTGPDRFGLTHADLRIANLLVDGDRTIVIDFDDCGLGLVHVRLGDSRQLHGGPPAGARAAGRLDRRLPLGGAALRPPTRPNSRRS